MYFLLAQVLFALWSIWFGYFQEPILKAFIASVPVVNPYERPFHKRGMLSSCIVALIIGLSLFALTKDWRQCALIVLPLMAIYKIFFDGIIGEKIHEDFFYLGNTAKQDIWLNSKFPHGDAGEVKVIICGAIIIILNLINYLL
jgi:hypothetical protein